MPAPSTVRSPVPGCRPCLRYDYSRELRAWVLSLPGRLLITFAFLVTDACAYFAWPRVTPPLARETADWSFNSLLDWLRPPPTPRQLERELLERYVGVILAPEWSLDELLEQGLLTLGRLLDTPVPPAGITLYPLADRWLGRALAGDLREPLVSETGLPEHVVAALRAGDALLTLEPRESAWLPLVYEERLVGCIEVRDPRCLIRAHAPGIRNLLTVLARALVYTPWTGSDDDLPPRA